MLQDCKTIKTIKFYYIFTYNKNMSNTQYYNNKGELIGGGSGGDSGFDLESHQTKIQNITEVDTNPNNTTLIGNIFVNEPDSFNYGQQISLEFGTTTNELYSKMATNPSGKGTLLISAEEVQLDCHINTNQETFDSLDLVSKQYVDDAIAAGGGSSGIEVGTLAQMLAKTGMTPGTQFFVNANAGTNFTSQENKLYYYSGRTWQVSGETIELVARVNLLKGQVLQISGTGATADFQAEKTTITGDADVIGIVANKDVLAGEWFACATSGLWPVACIAGTYARQNYLTANTNDGYASSTTSESTQPFAKIVEERSISIVGGKVWALLNIIAEIY